jgi:hypothetical protein
MNKHSLPWIGYVVCVVAVTVSGSRLIAQGGTPGQANRVTVMGCIKPSGNTPNADLTIKDLRGGPAPSFRVTGDADLLKLHTGHTVEIVGSVTGSAGSGPSANLPTLRVEKLQWLASRCWESPEETKK